MTFDICPHLPPMKNNSPARRLFFTLTFGALTFTAAHGSDFGDSPSIAQDQGADLGDAYFFVDPNDGSRAILALTVHGSLLPGAPANAAAFDSRVKFFFEIENTGDAVADKKLNVRFDAPAAPGAPQTAHVKGAGVNFTASTTPATLEAPAVKTDAGSGFQFFAGPVDDPFFGDLAGVNRYLASARNGSPNAALLARGLDTSAGSNTLAIAISVPVSYLRGASNAVGLSASARRRAQTPLKTGGYVTEGAFVQVDRVANPGINLLFVPPARQDEYNGAKTADDAAGKFAGDIAANLQSVGADGLQASILRSIAVDRGDFLRLDLTVSNRGAGGGSNPEAGFPNGRRLGDDAIDTLLNLVANGAPLGDGVDSSDVAPRDVFPFFGPPHQP